MTILKSQIFWILLKTSGAISTKIMKLALMNRNCINESVNQNKFPNKLKVADIAKKEDSLEKSEYRSTRMLPTVSKVFGKNIIYSITMFFK